MLYPALEQIARKYRDNGGVELVVQTTGDILTEKHIVDLLERGVGVISVSGMDEYHDGFESQEARDKLRAKLLDIINREEDSLRIYFLYGARETRLEVYGRDTWTDMSGPLIA